MNEETGPQSRVRLSDVARVAGVSTATVSRVLSNPGLVAMATRDAVAEAVRRTGYRMNHAARNLRKGRTGCVVALVPNLGNPFFAKILDGMGRGLAAEGYDLLVADTHDHRSLAATLHRFQDPSRADGIILLDGRAAAADLRPAPDLPPVVTACEWVPGADLPRVMLDNRMGARLAITHLRQLGHRRIGLIGGPAANVLHQARLAGAQDAAGDLPMIQFEGDFSLQSGQEAARRWLAMPPASRPSAIFAFSDEMACGFVADVMRAGMRVPADVSVIGFDDIELASHLFPALTTIRQPKRDLGRMAAQVVLAVIAGKAVPPVTLLEPQLMPRETTATWG
ncbi:transcriptional regulator, LacI family [Paracoccus aminovorans]|uniref:Transcriptional regulator, LacI family n=1 Tax=Paracoccus aminovorans TaxID=34004 RepID=A0A1I3F2R7_9RHOB|nr:LacI family DNA-binding transcriptional regulator [Paracoccus aminovorans]CQR84508.1 transcriptional regulator [Paracoccus aminovorans]SFI05536.1 transcriptional regulator, LacI family [Paracoccus aminovorans]